MDVSDIFIFFFIGEGGRGGVRSVGGGTPPPGGGRFLLKFPGGGGRVFEEGRGAGKVPAANSGIWGGGG